MRGKMDATVIEGAGGIVERISPEGVRIAVIYRERYGPEWALPKGKRESGESWQETALREVEEEIGLRPTIIGVAGATAYLASGIPKLVLYWQMRVEDQPVPFQPNEEVRELEWLPFAEAIERLTHKEEAHIVQVIMHEGSA